MVPSLLQLVRRGRGHLDAASRSCEILQSSPPCEGSTYYATEKSICLGRPPPPEKLPPQHHPSSPPLLHPSLPFSRQPPWLSTKWAACQIEEGFTLPLWIREWVHSTVMQWKLNPPASLQCRCWIDTYVTWVWLCTILSFLRFCWSCLCFLSHKNASQFVCFLNFRSKKAKETRTWSWVHFGTLMCRWTACGVNQLLMHADRHGSDSILLPPFHQFPCTFALINAVHLFEMRCDRPVSFHYSISEQTVMLSGPLLVFYQQVLMLL